MTVTRFLTRTLAAVPLLGGLLAAPQAGALEIMASHYGALLNTAPIAVALERGDYAKNGVDVTDVMSSVGGGTGIRNMVGGGLGYGIVSTSTALAGIKQGMDIRIVHTAIRRVDDLLWVTRPDSGISSIKDLVGKKVGITAPKSSGELLVNMAFEAAGYPGKADMVALGSVGSGLSALEQGGVDAALILEPLYSARKDRYKVAFSLENLPSMTPTVGVATGDFMRKNPEQLRGLLAAWRSAVNFIYENPEEAAKMVSKRYGDTLPLNVATISMKRMAEIKYWSQGEFDMDALNIWVKGMERLGEWSGPVDWSRVLDGSFLAADLRN
ncbi:ABC transporter substrate-binding protein [Azospirillum agricola]|uniref:ABC transporter substrate-binding protein n=1 Tax=Azospirillum agricola TaxID=1720247 RepID=UPI000A0F2176|nr:ABC transporter substrate-binding protein [Azospirillum agricola]SMH30949.1 NitT/TauT family transport system substrate-binding protein [Azospirillum lipoferum]